MGQYDSAVERQRLLLAAEEWASGVENIHVHGLSSMWYDDKPEHTENGKKVTDVTYNNGMVERRQQGKVIHYFGEKLTGDDLISAYTSKNSTEDINRTLDYT
mgnify:CR=1 FL=1